MFTYVVPTYATKHNFQNSTSGKCFTASRTHGCFNKKFNKSKNKKFRYFITSGRNQRAPNRLCGDFERAEYQQFRDF